LPDAGDVGALREFVVKIDDSQILKEWS